MQELDFNIPNQNLATDQLDPKPKAANISKWLDKLPLVNPEHSTRLLTSYLSELNQCKLNYADRYNALELLRPICENLIASLRSKYSQAKLPLSEKNKRYFQGSISLNNLLCIGYKSSLYDAENNNINASKEKIVIFSLYHAIQQLSFIMLECYLVYRPVPVNAWHEIHPLFKTAEDTKLTDTLIPTGPDNQTETIAISYKRALLLSLTNPYHLMQDEAYTVFIALSKLSQGLRILPYPKNEAINNGFAIDLNSAQAPIFLSPNRKTNFFEPRLLNMDRLIDALNSHSLLLDKEIEEHIQSNHSSLSIRMKRDLLLRMHENWSRSRERFEQRETTLGHKDIVIGLSTAHYHASNKVPFNPELDEINTYAKDVLETSGLFLIPKDYEPWKTDEAEHRLEAGIDQPRSSNFDAESGVLDKWEKIYSAKSSREHDEINQNATESETSNISSWEIKNQSQAGMSLFCQSKQCLPVRVGELMSYRDNKTWNLGVIRWLHANEDCSIGLGIMLLSSLCKSVATRAISGIGKGGEYMRSLLIDATELNQENAKLLLPAAIYHVGTELVVNVNGIIKYVKLTQQVLGTKSLNMFSFEIIDIPETETKNIKAMQQLLE